jgi:hypothetical protein
MNKKDIEDIELKRAIHTVDDSKDWTVIGAQGEASLVLIVLLIGLILGCSTGITLTLILKGG